jgi:hypothetical protein
VGRTSYPPLRLVAAGFEAYPACLIWIVVIILLMILRCWGIK